MNWIALDIDRPQRWIAATEGRETFRVINEVIIEPKFFQDEHLVGKVWDARDLVAR